MGGMGIIGVIGGVGRRGGLVLIKGGDFALNGGGDLEVFGGGGDLEDLGGGGVFDKFGGGGGDLGLLGGRALAEGYSGLLGGACDLILPNIF